MTLESVTIGPCKLYLGDCRQLIASGVTCDAMVTDPPYGVGMRNGDVDGHRSARSFAVAGDEDQIIGQEVLDSAERDKLLTIAFASPWKPWQGKWRNMIAWNKGGAVGGGGDIKTCLKRSWELIQVARNGPILLGGRQESVVHFPITPADTAAHICAKPVALMSWLLRTFVPRRTVVFDPFMGRCPVGVACIQHGCEFIGCEVDREHFDGACRRIEVAWRDSRSQLPFDAPSFTQPSLLENFP